MQGCRIPTCSICEDMLSPLGYNEILSILRSMAIGVVGICGRWCIQAGVYVSCWYYYCVPLLRFGLLLPTHARLLFFPHLKPTLGPVVQVDWGIEELGSLEHSPEVLRQP